MRMLISFIFVLTMSVVAAQLDRYASYALSFRDAASWTARSVLKKCGTFFGLSKALEDYCRAGDPQRDVWIQIFEEYRTNLKELPDDIPNPEQHLREVRQKKHNAKEARKRVLPQKEESTLLPPFFWKSHREKELRLPRSRRAIPKRPTTREDIIQRCCLDIDSCLHYGTFMGVHSHLCFPRAYDFP